MAEKITLAKIDIDYNTVLKDSAELKKRVDLLTESLNEAKKAEGDNTEAILAYEASLKNAKTELRQNQKALSDLETEQRTEIGTIEKLNKQNALLRKEQKSLNLQTKEGAKRNKEIITQINANTKALQDNSDEFVQAKRNVGNYTGELTSLSPVASQAANGISMVGKAVKIALSPFGLIIAAVGSLIAYFKRSERGQNSFNKIMKVTGVIIGNIADAAAHVGEMLFKAATQPGKAWDWLKAKLESIGNWFSNTFGNIFLGTVEYISAGFQRFVALVDYGWQKLKGQFTENTAAIQEAAMKVEEQNKKIEESQKRIEKGWEGVADTVSNAYESATSAVGEFIAETQREIEVAKELADTEAELERMRRADIVLTAKESSKLAALQNEINEKDKLSAEERIDKINEYNNLLTVQSDRRKAIAEEELRIVSESNKLSESTKEDLMREAELRAELFNIEKNIEDQRRRIISLRVSAEREIVKAKEDQAKAALSKLNEELNAEIEQKRKLIENEQQYNEARLETELSYAEEKLNQELITMQEYQALITEARIEWEIAETERRNEANEINAENRLNQVTDNKFAELQLKEQALMQEMQAEIEYANRVGADTTLIKDKYRKQQDKIDELRYTNSLSLASQAANALVTIFGETTTAGKIAATAAATIDTLQSAVSSFKAMAGIPYVGPILGGIAAAAALTAGYSTIDEIWSVDTSATTFTKPSSGGKSKSTYSSIGSQVKSASTSAITTANTQLGQGIVARNTGIQEEQQASEKILVVDEVTAAQEIQNEKANLSTT